MTNPINNGTTTELYRPKIMYTPRPGADAHLAIPSLITGNAPARQEPLYVAPPVNVKPKGQLNMEPKKRGRPAKPSTVKTLPKDEDYSTPYRPPIPKIQESLTVECQTESKDKSRPNPISIDLNELVICEDPYISRRPVTGSIYDDLFGRLIPGQCIKCYPGQIEKLGNALRKHIKTKRLTGLVARAVSDYGDGMGRVWLLKVK